MTGNVPSLGQGERELLINCARLELSPALIERTQALMQEKLDWERTLPFAEAHSVAALLRHQLQQLGSLDLVPPEARQRLLQVTHRTAYRNHLYAAALAELLDLFGQGGVPVMVLKGLALVELVYLNRGLRPLIDLNLLVPVERLAAARRLLARRGYRETQSGRSPFYQWSHSQIILVKPGEFSTHVVLQWGVVTWPKMHAIDLHRFWQDAQSASLSGADTLIPSPVDFVLYLCLQADKYAFLNRAAVRTAELDRFIFDEQTHNRLIRFTDLYETARHYRHAIDGELLIDRARSSGIEDSVYASLGCVGRLFGPVTVPSVLQGLHLVGPARVRRLAYKVIFGPSADRTSQSSLGTRFRDWWLRMRSPAQRRWIKLLDLIEYIFPRPDVLRRRHQATWGRAAVFGYPLHVTASLLRCALHLPTWVSDRARERIFRRSPPEAHGLSSRTRLLHSKGVGPL